MNSIDVLLTTWSLFERTYFSQYAITPLNKQERKEQSWWYYITVSCVGQLNRSIVLVVTNKKRERYTTRCYLYNQLLLIKTLQSVNFLQNTQQNSDQEVDEWWHWCGWPWIKWWIWSETCFAVSWIIQFS